MNLRIYTVTMGTGRKDRDGVELEVLLNLFTTSAGADEFAKKHPGCKITKMLATPEGATPVISAK